MVRILPLVALLGLPSFGWAEENLLWKATSTIPAQVVPAYTGQGNPFPVKVEATPEQTSETEVMDEQARMREEAYNFAQGLLTGGNALQPEVRSVRVGGTLMGSKGARVLLNNAWLGVGDSIRVRQVKTSQALNAIKVLADYDAAAAAELGANLNATLAATPAAQLTVTSITSNSVVLEGSHGRTILALPSWR